jgi:hypothetical protein
MRTLVCRHCGREVLRNKRLKHLKQQYCGDKACQAARKLSFDRKKYITNSLYRSDKLQRARDRRRKQEAPQASSHYQRNYRAAHPDYAHANRQKQRVRNASRAVATRCETKIVNPDALMLQHTDNDAVYAMIAVDYNKIVNPDALMPYLSDIEVYTKQKPLLVRLL